MCELRFKESSEGKKLVDATVKTGPDAKVDVSLELLEDGYVKFLRATESSGGASWDYDGSIEEDVERFGKAHKGLIGMLAKKIRKVVENGHDQ